MLDIPRIDAQDAESLAGSMGQADKSSQHLQIFRKMDRMENILGALEDDKTTHFVTAGTWSLHELVEYCVEKWTGPAVLNGFTWSLYPSAAELFINMKNDGRLEAINFIADCSFARLKMKGINLLAPHCVGGKIHSSNIHAKGFVLVGKDRVVSCISSANFSNNPRIEAGSLTTNRAIAERHLDWMEHVKKNADYFFLNPEFELGLDVIQPEPGKRSLFLVRGLPGSGKSTLAHSLVQDPAAVCENDDFFTNDGVYFFDHNQIQRATGICYRKCQLLMEAGADKIAVANTFTNAAEMRDYFELAKAHGYTVFSIISENRHEGANVHGVTDRHISKMKNNFKVKL